MKTNYKDIRFEHLIGAGKAAVWTGYDKRTKSVTGIVNWYIRVRRFMYFTFIPLSLINYDSKCTQDICHFVEQLNKEQ